MKVWTSHWLWSINYLWGANNVDKIEYSWFQGKGKQRVAARLDYFIISDEIRTRIENIAYKPGGLQN